MVGVAEMVTEMAKAAAVDLLVPMAKDSALRMDPEETKYLACPMIADDSLACEDTDVSQGGRNSATASGRLRGKFRILSGWNFRRQTMPFHETDDSFSSTRSTAIDSILYCLAIKGSMHLILSFTFCLPHIIF